MNRADRDFAPQRQATEGSLADKSTQLVLEALGRAAVDPDGVPLHGNKKSPGLFATTTAAKQTALRCKEEGYLRVVRSETKGKTVTEVCCLTEKGLAYLLSQVSPKQVLEDFVRALETRRGQVDELINTVRHWQANLDSFKFTVEKVLLQVGKPVQAGPNGTFPGGTHQSNGSDTWLPALIGDLNEWQASGALEDCPLPELYRRACRISPSLTFGHFHDGLRQLHDSEQIYLHPWTGPLHEIPEPAHALLVGHEIAYYASVRK
jgi:hypothetical protein